MAERLTPDRRRRPASPEMRRELEELRARIVATSDELTEGQRAADIVAFMQGNQQPQSSTDRRRSRQLAEAPPGFRRLVTTQDAGLRDQAEAVGLDFGAYYNGRTRELLLVGQGMTLDTDRWQAVLGRGDMAYGRARIAAADAFVDEALAFARANRLDVRHVSVGAYSVSTNDALVIAQGVRDRAGGAQAPSLRRGDVELWAMAPILTVSDSLSREVSRAGDAYLLRLRTVSDADRAKNNFVVRLGDRAVWGGSLVRSVVGRPAVGPDPAKPPPLERFSSSIEYLPPMEVHYGVGRGRPTLGGMAYERVERRYRNDDAHYDMGLAQDYRHRTRNRNRPGAIVHRQGQGWVFDPSIVVRPEEISRLDHRGNAPGKLAGGPRLTAPQSAGDTASGLQRTGPFEISAHWNGPRALFGANQASVAQPGRLAMEAGRFMDANGGGRAAAPGLLPRTTAPAPFRPMVRAGRPVPAAVQPFQSVGGIGPRTPGTSSPGARTLRPFLSIPAPTRVRDFAGYLPHAGVEVRAPTTLAGSSFASRFARPRRPALPFDIFRQGGRSPPMLAALQRPGADVSAQERAALLGWLREQTGGA